MKRLTKILLLAGIAALLSGGCAVLGLAPTTTVTTYPPPSKDSLRPVLPKAYTDAMSLKVPKILFFTSDYDPTSPDVRPHVEAVQKAYGKRVRVVPVISDTEEWSMAVADHKVIYFPTVLVTDSTGAESKRFEGYVDRKTIEKAVNAVLSP